MCSHSTSRRLLSLTPGLCHQAHLRKFQSQDVFYCSLSDITAALRTFPALEYLRCKDALADRAAFVAEVQAADRRGMRRIELRATELHSSLSRDLQELQRNMRWVTLRL